MRGSRKFRWKGGGGGGERVEVLKTYFVSVINVFHRGLYGPPSRSDWIRVQLLLEGVRTSCSKET